MPEIHPFFTSFWLSHPGLHPEPGFAAGLQAACIYASSQLRRQVYRAEGCRPAVLSAGSCLKRLQALMALRPKDSQSLAASVYNKQGSLQLGLLTSPSVLQGGADAVKSNVDSLTGVSPPHLSPPHLTWAMGISSWQTTSPGQSWQTTSPGQSTVAYACAKLPFSWSSAPRHIMFAFPPRGVHTQLTAEAGLWSVHFSCRQDVQCALRFVCKNLRSKGRKSESWTTARC